MDAYAFVRAVARFIDKKVDIGAEKLIPARSRRSRKRIVMERDIAVALVAAILETLPHERAFPLFPNAPIVSAKSVADRLFQCAVLRFEGPAEEAAAWPRTRGFHDCLRRTFEAFLARVKSGRDQQVRILEDRIRLLKAVHDLDLAQARKLSIQHVALYRKHEALKALAEVTAFQLATVMSALAEADGPASEWKEKILRLLSPQARMVH